MTDHLAGLRRSMETLAYHLEVHLLVMSSGSAASLSRAAADVEQSVADLAAAESGRAPLMAQCAAEQGVPQPATLGELVASAPEQWRALLEHERDGIDQARATIDGLVKANQAAARLGMKRTRELMTLVGAGDALVEGYGPTAASPWSSAGRGVSLLLDRTA